MSGRDDDAPREPAHHQPAAVSSAAGPLDGAGGASTRAEPTRLEWAKPQRRELLARIARGATSIELVDATYEVSPGGPTRDALQIVLVTEGKPPRLIEVNHRDIGALREALGAFDERVHARHVLRRPTPRQDKARAWREAEYQHKPGVPRGSVEPPKEGG